MRTEAKILNQSETMRLLGLSRARLLHLERAGLLRRLSAKGRPCYRRTEVERLAGGEVSQDQSQEPEGTIR